MRVFSWIHFTGNIEEASRLIHKLDWKHFYFNKRFGGLSEIQVLKQFMLLCPKFELFPTSSKVAKLEAPLKAIEEWSKKSYSVE